MMARLYPVIVVLWLLAGVSRFGEGTSNPGFVARVSRKGLEYACQYGVTILNKQLSNLRLPDFLGSYKAGWFGNVSYELHRLKIHHFRLGDAGLDLLPEHDVEVSLSNNFLRAGGSWKVEKEFIILEGTFDLRLDISISASLRLGKDQAGRPTASVVQCSNSIGHVSIDTSGSLSWIFNLFHEKIEHGIKSLLEQEVCKEVRKLAGSYLEPYLHTLPVTTVIDQFAGIDYSLVEAPQVTAEGLDTSFKGEFFSLRQRTPVPFAAPAIRLPQRHDHMLYFAISQYIFNTASHVYQKAGRTRIIIQNNQVTNLTNLTSQSARKWWKQSLNSSCLISNSTSLTAMVSCLSSNILRLLLQVPTESPISLQTNLLRGLFPSLARLFPDMEVEFEASPESQPLLTFTPGNVTFMPVMDIRISALQSNSSAHRPLFHLRAKANISASISVRSGKIFGSVASGSNLKLELKHSSVSYFHVKLIEVIINHFVFKVVLPFLNAKLQEGFSLPLPNNTFISSLELQIHKNFLLLAANID